MVRYVVRATALALCAVTMLSAAPATAAGHRDWSVVTRIDTGTRIAVYGTRRSRPDACDFLSADEISITCTAVDSSTRMVFPRATVREVTVFEEEHDYHIGTWIAAGISIGLVAAACVLNPLGGVMVGAMLLGGWSAWADMHVQFPPPPGPRIRRHVVYRAPISATP